MRESICEQLRRWRKHVKRFYYQTELSAEVNKKPGVSMKRLDKLNKRPGRIHDLCVLKPMIAEITRHDNQHEQLQNI